MRKTLVLDTPMLMLFAVGIVRTDYIARHKRLHPPYTALHYNLLRALIEQAPAVATTTHVLTEASNLLRYCGEPMRSEIMVALAGIIGTIDEITPRASEVCLTSEFVRFGLTDAALTRLEPDHVSVASADIDLILALTSLGFEVVNFHELLTH